jgi:DNA-binding NarL/FixJ family response regulator
MNILTFSREQVKGMAEQGFLNKQSVLHYDVCRALAEGKTQAQVAEQFNISDENVKWIKKRKCCKDC